MKKIFRVYWSDGLFSDTKLIAAVSLEHAIKKARSLSIAEHDGGKRIASIEEIGLLEGLDEPTR